MHAPYDKKVTVPSNVRLPKELHERVARYSQEHQIPLAVLIRLALAEYLDRHHAP